MSNFETILSKLEQFVRKYYTNELLKGAILFFAIGFLYFLFTLFIEFTLWLNPNARTWLFWMFIAVEFSLFVRFIAFPLLHLLKLKKGIDYDAASKLIGNHFPEVSDKLLNVIQLNKSSKQSDLLLASIEQKSKYLKPIPFKSAINLRSNAKYLKYAAVPVLILLLSWLTGKIDWFSDSYERVVNYKTAYEPPAPFQFFVLNESLKAVEGKDFKLRISAVGEVLPENVRIEFNDQSYFLQPNGQGAFQYVFNLPKLSTEFVLKANDVVSRPYLLEVLKTPKITNFDMVLDYPGHTNKKNEVIRSSGSAMVPEGTNVTWRATTRATTDVRIYATDTLEFSSNNEGKFQVTKRLFNNFNYTLTTSNRDLSDYESLSYSIGVVKDAYPEINIKMKKDSLGAQSLYFYGQVSDDYGLRKLQLVYFPTGEEKNKSIVPLDVSATNFSDFVSVFPNELSLQEGKSYQLYFEVFDNDALHNFKRTKSAVFDYRKLTKKEEEQKQLEEQSKTIEGINSTFEKLKEQDQKLEEFSKTQKEKERLNFNDKKRFEDFLKRQKQQEQLMKNFNKKLQDNLEEFQKEKKEQDEFKEDLKQRLKENEEQLKKDENLLKELEEYKDKIDKEDFTQKLEELAKQNKNKQRSMKQLLELTKRFYVMKKAEKIATELDQLSQKQQRLSEKEKENTSEAQKTLQEDFKKVEEGLDDLERENRRLQKPMSIQRDEFLESEIKFDQEEAKKSLEKKELNEDSNKINKAQESSKQAQKRQNQAAQKLKELSEKMSKMAGGGGGGNQTGEDAEMLRQILENLLLYSFDQEALMNTFEDIEVDNNKYGKYIIEQSNLREHFEHIDDSLFALSLRQPKLSEKVNSQITDVYFNIDKALDLLTENRLYQGVAAQQYAITAGNELASFLSDVLDNMEMSMNPTPGSGGGQGVQLPDIIKTQEEIRKEAEEGMKEGEKGQGEKEGQKGKEGEGQKEGEDGKEGEGSKEGQEGKSENGNGGEKGETGSEGNGEGDEGGEGNKEGNGGKEGQNQGDGKSEGNGKDGRNGYGQGGNEEQNAELFKIYQRQLQLRQALEDKLMKDGRIQSAGDIIKQMEDIESDLLNYGFTNQTLQKMMDVQHQLLKLENATFLQGEDSKRESETNKKEFNLNSNGDLLNVRDYFNTTEILNRQPLPLRNHLRKKVQSYFKSKDDNL